jgi:hypothetical protein
VRVYQVSGLDANGVEVAFATTDTAALAIKRLQEARARYLRAWVSDETGSNVSVPLLLARAAEERSSEPKDDAKVKAPLADYHFVMRYA